MALTDTQKSILTLIVERIEADGMPPSQTEISRAMGFKSVRAAQYHLEALESAGVIERMPGRARGIRLTQTQVSAQAQLALAHSNEDVIRIPVLGRVAAGAPIGSAADGHDEESVVLDHSLFHPAPDYLLRVEGDSMREDGILEGDLVGVRRTEQAHDGLIVVARLDGEITIKRLELSDSSIRLLPSNADYAPIPVSPDADFAIEGLYCGLIRPNRRWR